MTRRRWSALTGIAIAMALAAAPAGAGTSRPARAKITQAPAAPAPPPALRTVPQGSAVRLDSLRRDKRYRDTFLREFDALTPENEMKMQSLQPRRGVFDFAAADELVAFAKEHHKQIHGHALVWGLQVPLWLVDHGLTENLGLHLPPLSVPPLPLPAPLDTLDTTLGDALTTLTGWKRDELLGIMRNHIDTVMRHFGSDVPEWDVVNEPMAENGALADNVWRRFIGADYIEQALRTAHAANPRAKLFINEYAVESPNAKLDGLVRLVRDLKAGGVPLDGVGLQYHTHIQGFVDEATLTQTMQRLAALGVEVQITEMDVGTTQLSGTPAQRFARQAVAYGDAARACNAVTACTKFTTWGFTDRVSWLGPAEMGLPFDSQYQPKPAYDAVRGAFAPRVASVLRHARRLGGVLGSAGRRRVGVGKAPRAP